MFDYLGVYRDEPAADCKKKKRSQQKQSLLCRYLLSVLFEPSHVCFRQVTGNQGNWKKQNRFQKCYLSSALCSGRHRLPQNLCDVPAMLLILFVLTVYFHHYNGTSGELYSSSAVSLTCVSENTHTDAQSDISDPRRYCRTASFD